GPARLGPREDQRAGHAADPGADQGHRRGHPGGSLRVKAVVCEKTELSVAEVDDPTPGPGQLLLDVTRCGICGSDLHSRVHADALADVAGEIGYDGLMRTA